MKIILMMILMFGLAESRIALVGGINYSSIESDDKNDKNFDLASKIYYSIECFSTNLYNEFNHLIVV